VSPYFGESMYIPKVTREQINSGAFVGKTIFVDFFDWNQIQKHVFLGRASFEITPETFLKSDTVEKVFQLRDLKEGEQHLTNPKVKKAKSTKDVTSPRDKAKGQSKKNLLSHGLGEVSITLMLDDANISKEELEKIQATINLSSEKIKKIYSAYVTKGKKEEITTVSKFVDILNECALFEACMVKFGGNDPTANEHWNKLKEDADFMNELCQHLFKAFDVNGDGSVSFDELCLGIFSLLEGNSDDILKMKFRSIDLDHSGYIDMKEATILGGKTMAIIRVSMMFALHQQKYELMSAGLSENDFLQLIDAIDDAFKQHNYAQKEAKLLFKYADKDENGQITEDEYIAYMKDEVAQAERQRELDIAMKPVLESIQTNIKSAMLRILKKIGL